MAITSNRCWNERLNSHRWGWRLTSCRSTSIGRRDDLFHLPLDLLAEFLDTLLSRHFVIRNDYGLYEYTVYVYHDCILRPRKSEMAKVVLFGLRDFASLAHFYLKYDSPHEVAAFTVDREFVPANPTFEGLSRRCLSTIWKVAFHRTRTLPSLRFRTKAMNRPRQDVYERFKQKGYRLISYISSRATCFPGTSIGDNCFILEDNTIQPFVRIGNNVVLWSGNHIGHHSTIGDHAFFTSHVVLSGHCVVEEACFFGVNATVRDGLQIFGRGLWSEWAPSSAGIPIRGRSSKALRANRREQPASTSTSHAALVPPDES